MSMQRLASFACLLCLLYGCGGGGFMPYASHALSAAEIRALVAQASSDHALPPGLVDAVIMAESGGDPSAISVAGAEGLMQLMPGTAAGCGIADPFEPVSNVECGSSYLKGLLVRYRGNTRLAVAAYNAGPGAVDRYHGVPPYAETQAYVVRVLSTYRSY
ncbi:MAG TPA: lytic transglycosylase domain-containing protein [Candidatus Tyrphobacter sp.]